MIFKDILCVVNVQHDFLAESKNCKEIQHSRVRQERVETMKTQPTIAHASTNAYLLNTHALHNYQVVALVVPQTLLDQIGTSLVVDHQSVRAEAAKIIQSQKKAKSKKSENANTEVEASVASTSAASSVMTTRRKGKERADEPVPENVLHSQGHSFHFPAPHTVEPVPHHQSIPPLMGYPQYQPGHFLASHPILPNHPHHSPTVVAHPQYHQGHFVAPHPIPPSNHPLPFSTHLQHQQAGPSALWLPASSGSPSGTSDIPANYLHSFNVNEK